MNSNSILQIINDIDRTFKKDDIQNVPREMLENLILRVYDKLDALYYELREGE